MPEGVHRADQYYFGILALQKLLTDSLLSRNHADAKAECTDASGIDIGS